MRALWSVAVLVAVSGAAAAPAAAQCDETLEGGGMSGYLIGERVLTSYHGRWFGEDLVVFQIDETVGLYRMGDGSLVVVSCRKAVRV